MTKQTNIDQSLKTTPLPFELVAVPRDNVKQLLGTASDSLHMPVNVKIRIRNTAATGMRHDIVSISKFTNSKKIRLVNSDQTIMSFDLFMEPDIVKKHQKKTQNKFLQLFKTGGCLGIQTDDDIYNYAPSSSYSTNRLQSTSYIINTQNQKALENFPLKKNLNLVDGSINDDDDSPKNPKRILGKCRPGGCLDPPFSEDKYVYKPQLKELPFHHDNMEDQNKITQKIQDDLEIEQKAKDVSKGIIEEIYSNSLITYPTLSSSEIQIQEENQKKKLRSRTSSENKARMSVNEFSETYFMPSKRAMSKTSYKSNNEYRKTLTMSEVDSKDFNNMKKVDREALILSTKNEILTCQSSESKLTTETIENEVNKEMLIYVDERTLQDGNLLEKSGEPYNADLISPLIMKSKTDLDTTLIEKYIDDKVENKENSFVIDNQENIELSLTETSILNIDLEDKATKSNNEMEFDIDTSKTLKMTPFIDINNALTIKDNLDVSSDNKQPKESSSILSKIVGSTEIPSLACDDSIVTYSLINEEPDHPTTNIFEEEYSHTEFSTKLDMKESTLKELRSSDEYNLESTVALNSMNELPIISEKTQILNNETSALRKDFPTSVINKYDIAERNNLVEDNNETESIDSIVSKLEYNEKSFSNKSPKIKENLKDNESTKSDQNIHKKDDSFLHKLRSQDSSMSVSQVYNLNLIKSSVTIDDGLLQRKDLDNIDVTSFDANAISTSEADDKLNAAQDVHIASDINFVNIDEGHKNSIESIAIENVTYDQFKIDETEKNNSNVIGEDISITSVQDNTSIKSMHTVKEDNNKYEYKITNNSNIGSSVTLIKQSADINLSVNSTLNDTKEDIINNSTVQEILEKLSIQHLDSKIHRQGSIESKRLQTKLQSPSPDEGFRSSSSGHVITNLDLSTQEPLTIIQKKESVDSTRISEKYAKNNLNLQKVTDNGLLSFDALIEKKLDKGDEMNGFNEEKLLSGNSMVTVNLRFHSFVNDKNGIEINTLDLTKDFGEYPPDNVTIVKSIIRENDEAFRIPVNSEKDMTIQILPNNILLKGDVPPSLSVCERILLDKSTQVSIHTDVLLQETLNSIYETLIPVKLIIQDLIYEADLLTQQQQLLRDIFNRTSKTAPRLIPTSKTCRCLKRGN